MKKLFKIIFVYVSLVSSIFSQAVAQERLEAFLKNNFINSHVGLIAQSLPDNKILYQYNSHKLFVPASLLKLVTLAVGLEELTGDFKFTTKIKWDLQKKNFAIVFGGDPSLTHDDLEELIIAIKKKKVDSINGNLIIDDTIFSDSYANGWSNEDLVWYFAAPSEAIVIAENKIPIIIKPINELGQKVQFYIPDEQKNLYPFNINSNVMAVTRQQSEVDCKFQVKLNSENDIFFSGCVQVDPTVQKINLALNSPRNYIKNLILFYLRKHQIQLRGDILFAKEPDDLIMVKTHSSLPLIELLKTMIQNSNNIYAHNISKALGVKLYNDGSFKSANKAILNILQKKFTVNSSTLRIADSSGLSVYNTISPNHFIRLLQAMYNNTKFKEQILKILAQSGKSGLIKHRLSASDLNGKIFAKTGTLTNVSGVAGYAFTKNNKMIAFVFMVNNILQEQTQIKLLEDELCEILVNLALS